MNEVCASKPPPEAEDKPRRKRAKVDVDETVHQWPQPDLVEDATASIHTVRPLVRQPLALEVFDLLTELACERLREHRDLEALQMDVPDPASSDCMPFCMADQARRNSGRREHLRSGQSWRNVGRALWSKHWHRQAVRREELGVKRNITRMARRCIVAIQSGIFKPPLRFYPNLLENLRLHVVGVSRLRRVLLPEQLLAHREIR
eukprot:CAMPEP_0117534662 /NCGR_PEP_ID=MMETSP0784-20121206/40528_1 /TAXON_ID=39447 /ORGANISM="" /LENGTH=203 /DNA_ID=CAMNT_0005331151 /DNA_START=561 /DNA_END=1175 /DNA_ORIENTATION=-